MIKQPDDIFTGMLLVMVQQNLALEMVKSSRRGGAYNKLKG